jgi:hypothetical protein
MMPRGDNHAALRGGAGSAGCRRGTEIYPGVAPDDMICCVRREAETLGGPTDWAGHMTRVVGIIIFFLMFPAGATPSNAQRQQATTAPANPLIGRWEGVSIGDKVIPEHLRPFWIFSRDNITVTNGDGERLSRNRYSLEQDKSPRTITISVEGEGDRIGWFEIKERELRLLFTAIPGGPPQSWDEGPVMILRWAPGI